MRLASFLLLVPAVLPIACFLSIPDVPGETGGTTTTTSSGGAGAGGSTTSSGGTGGGGAGAGGGTMTSTSCAGLPYPDMIKCDGPAAYYRLDETTFVADNLYTTPDEMGMEVPVYKAELKGGDVKPGLDKDPLIGEGRSVLFQVSRHMLLTHAEEAPLAAWSFQGRTPFTIEMWIQLTQVPKVSELFRKEPTGGDHGYHLGIKPDPNAGDVGHLFMTRGEATVHLETEPITAGKTYHVVTTYDGTMLCLYLNAVGKCGFSTKPLTKTVNTATVLCGWEQTPNAYVDELALYYHALPPVRIQAHYLAGTSPM